MRYKGEKVQTRIIKITIYGICGAIILSACNSSKDNKRASTNDILTSIMEENVTKVEDKNISVKEESSKSSILNSRIAKLEKLVASQKENNYQDEYERLIGTLDVDKVNIGELEDLVKEADRESSKIEREVQALIDDKPKDKKIEDNSSLVVINKEIKVKFGDTLSSLALEYYDDASKYTKIYEANRDKIKEDYIIYNGETLLIP